MLASVYVGVCCSSLKTRRAWAIPSRQSKSYLRINKSNRRILSQSFLVYIIQIYVDKPNLPVSRNFNFVDDFSIIITNSSIFFIQVPLFSNNCFLSCLISSSSQIDWFGFETSSIKTKLEEGGRAHHIVELDAELEAQILKLFLSYNTVQYNQRTIKIERSEGNEAIAYSKIFLGLRTNDLSPR